MTIIKNFGWWQVIKKIWIGIVVSMCTIILSNNNIII